MEPGGGSSAAQAPVATWARADPGPAGPSLELPSADPRKLRALTVGPGGRAAVGTSPPDTGSAGEPGCGAKVPNRDSGIDSPSCSMASEPFPCEEGSEAGLGPTVLRLHPETAPAGKAAQEEANSDMGEGSGEEPEDSPPGASADPATSSKHQKLLHIAQELLHTEETYVRRLHLLDQVFCARLTEAGIPPEVTTGIFSNISSIYRFHGQFLLPELRARITQEWDTNPRLGDVLQKLAPFLKMYGEYVKNFDRAVELVTSWTQRSPPFRDVVHGIQKQEACGNLTLQHHMLEPVQRVPRYELLLKDYLKRLPADAPDRKDAERSLDLISTAANHSNAAIRKMEKMHKLLEVYERLGGEEDIVNPANELIKEGPILKLSAKSGSAQERHLLLFNSMILYCVPKRRLMGQKFSIREKMDVSDVQVQDVTKPHVAHTFIIVGRRRSLELQARTEEEKTEWIQVIEATIERHRRNSQTFKAFGGSSGQDEDPALPPDAPAVTASAEEPTRTADSGGDAAGLEPRRGSSKTRRDKDKQYCSGCGDTFNSITKRKHRCKLCGAVICGKCSEFKAEHGRQSRVCRDCFLPSSGDPASAEAPVEPAWSAEEKAASAEPLPGGPLQLSAGGSAWSDVWAALPPSDPPGRALPRQEASQDGGPQAPAPVPGAR